MGCAPDPDASLVLPVSQATGVSYYLHLVLLNGSAGIDIQPYNLTMIEGDSLLLTSANAQIFVNAGGGGGDATLSVKANGTPTNIGDPHPCGLNTNFTSDGNSCPEQFTHNVTNACVVSLTTVLNEAGIEKSALLQSGDGMIYRSASKNDFIQVFSSEGRLVLSASVKQGESFVLPKFEAGIYFLLCKNEQFKIVQP